MRTEKILRNFPAETDYHEMRVGDLLVCYKAGLSVPSPPPTNKTSSLDGPFGCRPSELTPYKHRRTANDSAFEGFVSGTGHFPDFVFEVKK